MKDLIYKHALINAVEHGGKADPKAVLGKVIAENPSVKSDIKTVIEEIKKIVVDVNSLPLKEQESLLKKLGVKQEEKRVEQGLADLPNVKGNVVMRLAPYPSGPLHIGNVRMVILNDEYVKRYKGKLLLVFDDTIGSEEKFILPEAYGMIIDGLKWMGVKHGKAFYKSDRIKIFYKVAEYLMKRDYVYVCECRAAKLRGNRADGIACAHREQSVEENLLKWKHMLNGEYKEGAAVLRLKTDMSHPNPAFRDRVLFRIAERKHPRVGKKYRVWPMLEFSWAVDDHLFGVTHILRGKDLMIEDEMERFIWDLMVWNKPEILHYGILNLEGAKLSKTESRRMIEKGNYSKWDDPRTWSLQSLRKRGIQPEAIRNFVKNMGLSLADVKVPMEILYSENRKLVDQKANRYFAVLEPVKISVKDAGKDKTEAQLHPDFPKRGKRKIPVDPSAIYVERKDFKNLEGQEVGLMNLLSIRLNRNSTVTSQDVKYEIQKIHWVSKPNVKIKVVMPDGEIVAGIAEPSLKKLKLGALVQFPRIGFVRLNKKGKELLLCFTHK